MIERDGPRSADPSGEDGEGNIREMAAKVLTLLAGVIAFLAFLQLPVIVDDYFPAGDFKSVLLVLLHEDGLLVIATILFSAGVGYLFFRGAVARFVARRAELFTDHVISSVNRGYDKVSESVTRRVATLDSDLVLRWIAEGHASPAEYKNTTLAAAKRYYTPLLGFQESYVEDVVNQFLNGWMGVGYWRKSMFAEIYLERLETPDLAGKELILWDETQSFTVICPAGKGTYTIPQEMGIEAMPEDLPHVLKILEFSIKASPAGEEPAVLFDLAAVLPRIDVKTLEKGELCQEKIDEKRSVTFEFERNFLTVKIQTQVDLKAQQTTITARQVCLLRSTDRQYYFVNALPTEGFNFSMRLGTNLRRVVFSDVTVTAEAYHNKAAINVKHTKTEPNTITRTVDGWLLPGSAIIVAWTES